MLIFNAFLLVINNEMHTGASPQLQLQAHVNPVIFAQTLNICLEISVISINI